MPVYVLTEKDRDLLRRVIDREQRRNSNPHARPRTNADTDFMAPEVYLAKAPTGGIPARLGNAPGSVECDIYKIVEGALVTTEFSKTVYNLGEEIEEETWVVVVRDKYGSWIVLSRTEILEGFTGVKEVVVMVACEDSTLTVTTEYWEFVNGKLVEIATGTS